MVHPGQTLVPGPDSGLWLLDAQAVDHATYKRFGHCLDTQERSRIATLTATRWIRGLVIARGFVRHVLGDLLDLAPDAVAITRTPCTHCGGPHGLAQAPGLHFSLSHGRDDQAQEMLLLAVGTQPVGADIAHPAAYAGDLAARLHPRDQAELATSPDRAEHLAALARARLGALGKARGTGLTCGPAPAYVGTSTVPARGHDGWVISDVEVPGRWCAAVARAVTS
ncbi:hypothetical protein [Nocardioides sp. AE5]|uniref:4'-phosphopantetheinyl transferase family protein n=1 Tax=Nocardioides sp. AE5 TaxID=2962573 RepID=UPI002881B4F9|nr:hypothetical protein [Nocardioides sp. AE5]MDT0203836.1 hypothetical protein [Nocardioides sp. AE5]